MHGWQVLCGGVAVARPSLGPLFSVVATAVSQSTLHRSVPVLCDHVPRAAQSGIRDEC
jgi:hypothetical protein